ncbi:MAG: YlzJ-like family protein [Bacillota bacterium]|nr:YlzJ-like family protein [Bacillota bacterium]MDP4170863.1 YlzJ-like family protein [Bacillota bacterium]
MILYTMMPQELIFPVDPAEYSKQRVVQYKDIPLLIESVDEQHAMVIRVMSSDPQHFLDERCCPGAKISFSSLEGLSSSHEKGMV